MKENNNKIIIIRSDLTLSVKGYTHSIAIPDLLSLFANIKKSFRSLWEKCKR